MKSYYERLRELREDRDLKQSDVANILNTTQQVYSRYENGNAEFKVSPYSVVTVVVKFKKFLKSIKKAFEKQIFQRLL